MPTSKDINSYPLELYAVVERVLTERIEVPVECISATEANKLRFQVYGLRKALIEAEEVHPLKEVAPKLSTKLSGNTLTICHIDHLVPEGLRKAAGEL